MKKRYVFSGLIICLFLGIRLLWAQDTIYIEEIEYMERNRVEYVSQLPMQSENEKKSLKGWFENIILGKKDLSSFQKPVYSIGSEHDKAIVLDQGNGAILIADGKEIITPRAIKKQDLYFPSLVAACFTSANELVFTDSKLNGIFILTEDKKKIRNINENLILKQPTGIAYSEVKDQVWVVETGAHQISILDNNGNRIETIGSRGDGPGQFNYPTHIWIDKDGTAYVVDSLNYRVQIFDTNGNYLSMFGENGNGTGYIARPKGIAVDSFGHIYLVDALFHCVQIFDREGNYLDHFGKQGSNIEEFWMPNGIYIDNEDHIYVSDMYNSRIQIFELIYLK